MSSRQENCAYGLLSENRHHKTAVSSSFTMIWFDVSNSWLKQKVIKNWITKIRLTDFIFVFWFLNQEKARVFAHLLSYLFLSWLSKHTWAKDFGSLCVGGFRVQNFFLGLERFEVRFFSRFLSTHFFKQGSKFILTTYTY